MMDCDPHLLAAYFDSQLSAEQSAVVERHVERCSQCRRELEQLQEASRLISEYAFEDLTPRERADLHNAIDDANTRRIWRLAGSLAAIAASVLIISSAWLMQLPPSRSSPPTGTVARAAEPWERVAMTLRPDPLESFNDQHIELADAQWAEWMLQGLTGKTNP